MKFTTKKYELLQLDRISNSPLNQLFKLRQQKLEIERSWVEEYKPISEEDYATIKTKA